MRLIDADALKNKLCEECFGDCTRDCYEVHLIKAQPTIQAEPVRRGRWLTEYGGHIHAGLRSVFICCSECGMATTAKWNYCPNCGALME